MEDRPLWSFFQYHSILMLQYECVPRTSYVEILISQCDDIREGWGLREVFRTWRCSLPCMGVIPFGKRHDFSSCHMRTQMRRWPSVEEERGRPSPRTQPHWNLDLRLPDSRTVQIEHVFKPPDYSSLNKDTTSYCISFILTLENLTSETLIMPPNLLQCIINMKKI